MAEWKAEKLGSGFYVNNLRLRAQPSLNIYHLDRVAAALLNSHTDKAGKPQCDGLTSEVGVPARKEVRLLLSNAICYAVVHQPTLSQNYSTVTQASGMTLPSYILITHPSLAPIFVPLLPSFNVLVCTVIISDDTADEQVLRDQLLPTHCQCTRWCLQ
jgi:hypothetical protein